MTVAVARSFQLPDISYVPDEIPRQFSVPDDPCSADELAGYEVLEAWQTLAGVLLTRSVVAATAASRMRNRAEAEEVAAAAVELLEFLQARTRARVLALVSDAGGAE